MFSYRHAFHAGNHADVFKHSVLVSILRYLTQKDTALMVLDTHAGAGLYRLDGDYANKSGEALTGIHPLNDAETNNKIALKLNQTLAPMLQNYLDLIRSFNSDKQIKIYPGSPFIIQRFLRDRDRLKAFELHPTDIRALLGNVAQLEAGRLITVHSEDSFEGIKKFLPPPSKRALILCDPSYELKSDYMRVQDMFSDSLRRFATGCYAIWYPIIPRPEAHDLPRRLKTIANKAGKPSITATLTVKSGTSGGGLPGSGMFIVNPPFTLQAELKIALPQMVSILAADNKGAGFTLG